MTGGVGSEALHLVWSPRPLLAATPVVDVRAAASQLWEPVLSLTPWTLRLGDQLTGAVILGEPTAKGRPQLNHRTLTLYTPTATRKAEERVATELRRVAPEKPYVEDVVAWLTFHCSGRRPPDGDNLEKLAWDAAKSVVWGDDSQVVEWHGRVFARSPKPRTEFVVTRLP